MKAGHSCYKTPPSQQLLAGAQFTVKTLPQCGKGTRTPVQPVAFPLVHTHTFAHSHSLAHTNESHKCSTRLGPAAQGVHEKAEQLAQQGPQTLGQSRSGRAWKEDLPSSAHWQCLRGPPTLLAHATWICEAPQPKWILAAAEGPSSRRSYSTELGPPQSFLCCKSILKGEALAGTPSPLEAQQEPSDN